MLVMFDFADSYFYSRTCASKSGLDATSVPVIRELAAACSLCNESGLEYTNGAYAKIGEPTETALIVLVEKLNITKAKVAGITPEARALACNKDLRSNYKKELTLEFTRDRKSMSVLVSSADKHQMLVKGAPERVLERSEFLALEDGTRVKLTDDMRKTILKKTTEYGTGMSRSWCLSNLSHFGAFPGSKTLRCLGFASVDTPPSVDEIRKLAIDNANFVKIEVQPSCFIFCESTYFI